MINKRTRRFLPVAAGAALIGALAVSPALAAETFSFDKSHTEIRVVWTHLGLSRQSALFNDYDGEVKLDEAKPEDSSVQVSIKAASAATRSEEFTKHLVGPDFFDAAKFPDITFKSTKVIRTGEKSAEIQGALTVHGVTKPVTLNATLNYVGEHPMSKVNPQVKDVKAAGFAVTAKISRSEFGIGKYVPAVSDEISVEIQTELKRTGG